MGELNTNKLKRIVDKLGGDSKTVANNLESTILDKVEGLAENGSGGSSESGYNAKLEVTGTTFTIVSALTEIKLIDTSNCTSFYSAFTGFPFLTKIPLLDTSNSVSFDRCFSNCNRLTTIPKINTSKATNMNNMFYSCMNLIEIPTIDTSKVYMIASMFYGCKSLKTVPLLSGIAIYNISNMFYNCLALENFGGLANLGQAYTQKTNNYNNYKLDLSFSTLLTHESLMSVINGLYDLNLTYDVANGGTLYTQTLNLGSTNIAKLTDEELQIAYDKGWTVT